MKKLQFIIITFLVMCAKLEAQKGRGHHAHPHHNKVVVVKRSHYRPNKIIVYHPHWHPNYACNRRWVYFPKYNFYWDNWRNQYVYWNGNTWFSQANTPTFIVNVNLEKEQKTELKDNEDDEDEIYKNNQTHQTEYKKE